MDINVNYTRWPRAYLIQCVHYNNYEVYASSHTWNGYVHAMNQMMADIYHGA